MKNLRKDLRNELIAPFCKATWHRIHRTERFERFQSVAISFLLTFYSSKLLWWSPNTCVTLKLYCWLSSPMKHRLQLLILLEKNENVSISTWTPINEKLKFSFFILVDWTKEQQLENHYRLLSTRYLRHCGNNQSSSLVNREKLNERFFFVKKDFKTFLNVHRMKFSTREKKANLYVRGLFTGVFDIP